MQWSRYPVLLHSSKCLLLVYYKRLKWFPHFCWCMQQLFYYPFYATAVVLSSINNSCSLALFLQKTFKQKKAAWISREFMWHLFFIQSHPPPISVTCSVFPLPPKLASEKNCKIKRWKFNRCKSLKNVFYPPI